MTDIQVRLGKEPVWDDLGDKLEKGELIHITEGTIQMSGLKGGMTSGRASIAIRIDLPDGKTVIVEVSYRSFLLASSMLTSQLGDDKE